MRRQQLAPWLGLLFCVFRTTKLRAQFASAARKFNSNARLFSSRADDSNIGTNGGPNRQQASACDAADGKVTNHVADKALQRLVHVNVGGGGPNVQVVVVALCLIVWRRLIALTHNTSRNTRPKRHINSLAAVVAATVTHRSTPLLCAVVLLVTSVVVNTRSTGICERRRRDDDENGKKCDGIPHGGVSTSMLAVFRLSSVGVAVAAIDRSVRAIFAPTQQCSAPKEATTTTATDPRTVGLVLALVAPWLDACSLARYGIWYLVFGYLSLFL
jgi:hypothetical protein